MSNRAGMQPVGEWRAYFAPVDRTSGANIQFDASEEFDVHEPRSPWIDVGWIKNLERGGSVDLEKVPTGFSGMDSLRFRKRCEGQLAFDFCEWGKLQMALSASSQHINLLSGSAYALANRDPLNLQLDVAAVAAFSVGDLVAVDVDLDLQVGFVGTGVSGAYVKDRSVLGGDYIRATCYNVAKVIDKTPTSLVLEQPLVGGAPANGAKVQKVLGFADREGASFVQEWSGLFILDEATGGRVMLFYPRLQTAAESGEVREAIGGSLEKLSLHAKFTTMPVEDTLDRETVVSYRYYIPSRSAPAY